MPLSKEITPINRTITMKTLFGITLAGLLTVTNVQADEVTFLNPQASSNSLPFSDAVKIGNQLILSGKIGIDPKTGKLAAGGFADEVKQTLANIKASLNLYNYQMSDVVKCTVILTDIKKFSEFNQIYKQHFSSPFPTRTTYAAAALALNAQIEIECMAAK